MISVYIVLRKIVVSSRVEQQRSKTCFLPSEHVLALQGVVSGSTTELQVRTSQVQMTPLS